MSTSLILGFFDGIHTAHRAVISSAINFAKDNQTKTVLVTFKESPAKYFGVKPEYIFSREHSIKIIKSMDVNEVVELDFSKIATMTADEYLKYLVKTFSPQSISTGYNHTFGFNKTGDTEFLKSHQQKYGYKYLCTTKHEIDGEIVSSTLVRKYLKEGNIQKANSILESNFILEGIVVHGAKLGRKIGFPTANIHYPEYIVKIPYGVYKVDVQLTSMEKYKNTKLPAMMNWGIKPTVNSSSEPIAEVHIPNFNEELYGETFLVELLDKIRGEKKFTNLEELKHQIQEDMEACSK